MLTTMLHWFKLGGFGMIPTTIAGLIGIVVGLLAVYRPTPRKAAALKSLPLLIMLAAVCGMASGMSAVGSHLDDPAFLRSRGLSGDALFTVGFVGTGEAMVNLWWGGSFAIIVTGLRLWVDVKLAPLLPR
jgi:hypothetical protein